VLYAHDGKGLNFTYQWLGILNWPQEIASWALSKTFTTLPGIMLLKKKGVLRDLKDENSVINTAWQYRKQYDAINTKNNSAGMPPAN